MQVDPLRGCFVDRRIYLAPPFITPPVPRKAAALLLVVLRAKTGHVFPSMSAGKIVTAAELARVRDAFATQGKKLVFTNGCFDLLHVGHIRYLQAARALGDALAVAVNGDASVRALKGPTRPVNPEADRAEVLAALACVDYVVIFPEVRLTNVLRIIRPQIYSKGGDYTPDTLDKEERAVLDEIGSQIRITPLVPGRSTTKILASVSCKN
jgi:rfaE bifunctional protein nucleotidyltransferase chain/domain